MVGWGSAGGSQSGSTLRDASQPNLQCGRANKYSTVCSSSRNWQQPSTRRIGKRVSVVRISPNLARLRSSQADAATFCPRNPPAARVSAAALAARHSYSDCPAPFTLPALPTTDRCSSRRLLLAAAHRAVRHEVPPRAPTLCSPPHTPHTPHHPGSWRQPPTPFSTHSGWLLPPVLPCCCIRLATAVLAGQPPLAFLPVGPWRFALPWVRRVLSGHRRSGSPQLPLPAQLPRGRVGSAAVAADAAAAAAAVAQCGCRGGRRLWRLARRSRLPGRAPRPCCRCGGGNEAAARVATCLPHPPLLLTRPTAAPTAPRRVVCACPGARRSASWTWRSKLAGLPRAAMASSPSGASSCGLSLLGALALFSTPFSLSLRSCRWSPWWACCSSDGG